MSTVFNKDYTRELNNKKLLNKKGKNKLFYQNNTQNWTKK